MNLEIFLLIAPFMQCFCLITQLTLYTEDKTKYRIIYITVTIVIHWSLKDKKI